jgi:hypothetical protein
MLKVLPTPIKLLLNVASDATVVSDIVVRSRKPSRLVSLPSVLNTEFSKARKRDDAI